MILGIDATNIRAGGIVTHLSELLQAADPARDGFSRIVVWGGTPLMTRLPERPWLQKVAPPALDRGLAYRAAWQRWKLSRAAREAGCDLLFVPGSSYAGDFRPVVAMSQNFLPWQWHEARRFGWSLTTLRLALLRITQSRTFRGADGLIVPSAFALHEILRRLGGTAGTTAVIPHGLDRRFLSAPHPQRPLAEYSDARPFRLLYVSTVDQYKHQWRVVEAVAALRKEGMPLALDLAGAAFPAALRRLEGALRWHDPGGRWARYLGEVPHQGIERLYAAADTFVYASTCETFGLILTEAMAAGVPIASSDRSSMPEVLGDAGVYFDPERSESIVGTLRGLVSDHSLRARLAQMAYERVQVYSWDRCARETFEFLAGVFRGAGRA